MPAKRKLNAENLKKSLWWVMEEVRKGERDPASADAIAGVARELIRTVRTQQGICEQAGQELPAEVIAFATSGESEE